MADFRLGKSTLATDTLLGTSGAVVVLSATCTTTVSMSRSVGKIISASTSTLAAVSKTIGKIVSVTEVTTTAVISLGAPFAQFFLHLPTQVAAFLTRSKASAAPSASSAIKAPPGPSRVRTGP